MKFNRVFSRREKILMIILVLLVIVALYYYLVDMPVRETLATADEEISLYDMQSTVLQAKLDRYKAMKAELDELKKKGEPTPVPQYDNLPSVITFLDTVLSTKKDYKLSLADPSFTENIARRNASVSFTASSYADACKAVETLQNCPFMCKVDNVSMTPKTSSVTDDKSISVSISIVFYEKVAK